jgi:hypothetical protein
MYVFLISAFRKEGIYYLLFIGFTGYCFKILTTAGWISSLRYAGS